jgi:hypothetical protein
MVAVRWWGAGIEYAAAPFTMLFHALWPTDPEQARLANRWSWSPASRRRNRRLRLRLMRILHRSVPGRETLPSWSEFPEERNAVCMFVDSLGEPVINWKILPRLGPLITEALHCFASGIDNRLLRQPCAIRQTRQFDR